MTDADGHAVLTSPSETWAELQRGNERFVAGSVQHPHQDAGRRALVAAGQTPSTALFGCSDSRLAAEIIFDQGLGDLFVVRNAGQVISDSVVGSLEYAVGVLGVSLIVVLGHDACGAVQAAIDAHDPANPPLPPHIRGLIAPIMPAVERVVRESSAVADAERVVRDSASDAAVDDRPDSGGVPHGDAAPVLIDANRVGKYHVEDTIAELLQTSEMISEAIAEGRLAIVGANYRLAEGRAVPDVVIGTV